MTLTGVTPTMMKKSTAKTMPLAILNSIVVAAILGVLLFLLGISNPYDLVDVLFWLWVAFSLVPALMHASFEHRPLGIACINACFEFVGYMLMGTILYLWAI